MTSHITTRFRDMREDELPSYLTWQPQGKLDIQRMLKAIEYLEELECNSVQDFDRLVDLSKVTEFDLYYEDLKLIATRRSQNASMACTVRCAVVVKDDLSHGMTRMYDALIDNPSIKIGIFRHLPEAKTWLNQHVEIHTTGNLSYS